MSFCVVAVVATLGRPRELERLLASLRNIERVIVCNNGADPSVRAVCEKAAIPTTCLDPRENLGCGGGLRLAEEEAWRVSADRMTHLLVLDDDAVLEPDTVSRLLEILDRHRADVIYPLITGTDERVNWTPGLIDRLRHNLGLNPMPVSDYRKGFAGLASEFSWAQGICLLAKREAVDAAGFHRGDFWVRGEDLDFSLRLTSKGLGIFTTEVVVKHLPPESTPAASPSAEYLRHAALIQNIAYLGLRQTHGRRIAMSLIGSGRRFISMWGLRAIPDFLLALWRGGVLAEPAGKGRGRTFQKRFKEVVNQ